MKKRLLTLFLLPAALFAQDTIKKTTFNVHAGTTLSASKYKQAFVNRRSISEDKVSFNFGAGVEHFVSDNVSLNLNANYFTTGAEKTGELISDIELQHLQFPVSVKAYISPFFYVEGGLYASSVLSVDTQTYNGDTNPDYIDNKSIDYGCLFGLGYSHRKFYISALYNIGFVDLIDAPGSDFDPDFDPIIDGGMSELDYKERYVAISVGYKF